MLLFFIDVAIYIYGPVQELETVHGICQLLTAAGKLFSNMSDALETAICRFLGISPTANKGQI